MQLLQSSSLPRPLSSSGKSIGMCLEWLAESELPLVGLPLLESTESDGRRLALACLVVLPVLGTLAPCLSGSVGTFCSSSFQRLFLSIASERQRVALQRWRRRAGRRKGSEEEAALILRPWSLSYRDNLGKELQPIDP